MQIFTASSMSSNFEGISFTSPVPEDRYRDVIVHLRHNFFADEPINKSVELCQPGEPHAELEEHSLSTLRDALSVMALDTETGEVIGVALNGVQHMGDLNAAQEKLESMTDGSFKQIFGLLYSLNQTLDLFSKYEVESVFECRILSVDSRFRGRGLAKELMKRSEEVAKDAGFKVFKEDATGLFSQKIAASLGHETVYEMEYSSYTNKDGEIIFNTPSPHNSLKIMVKLLQYSSAPKGGKGAKLEGITFQHPIPECRFSEVVDHMRDSFYVNEPLLNALGLGERGQPLPEMDEYCVQVMKHGCSIAAIDSKSDKVVAVSLNGVLRASDPDDFPEKLQKMQGKIKLIFELLYKSNLHLDLFCRYGVDKIYEVSMLSVDSNYFGRGLAKELLKRSDDLAIDSGFKIAKADCTGFYSQKLLGSFGFQKIHEIKYTCYKDKEGNPIFKPAPPHDSLAVMVKEYEICE